ncbi:MAG TPA: toll/interleukin-1 receptor domain-containing protein [Allosphingosinicella sp.]|nr:toll/interleukin-1 receptor domain-containing protein [Allosphingosinicella sp.]
MAVYVDLTDECRELCDRIRTSLAEGATRYRAERTYRRTKQDIEGYRQSCTPDLAEYFDIALDQLFSKDSVDTTIRRCDELVSRSQSDLANWYALALRARLTVIPQTLVANAITRSKALDVARRNGWGELVVVSVANWAFLGLLKEDLSVAREKLEEAKIALLAIPPEIASTDSTMVGIRGRLVSHEAKLTIRESIRDGSADLDTVTQVNESYEQVRTIISEYDHMRTNYTIEWADELHRLHREAGVNCLADAGAALEMATTSLDSHVCDLCRGYFHQVRGNHWAALAAAIAELNPAASLEQWGASKRDGEKSLDFFGRTSHPYTAFANEIIERAETEIAKLVKPDRIFLSHKGPDKALARRFRDALEIFGFKPWLDEDALKAGMPLDRALLQGMKESCAAVFFITPDFDDAGYLATEVDYAVNEERERKGEFSIITLVFSDAAGKTGTVPELLRRFVWKQPASELEALAEIKRALPLTLPAPRWP